MAKSKKKIEVEVELAIEVVESTVILNLPNEEIVSPGCSSRNFSKGKINSEEEPTV